MMSVLAKFYCGHHKFVEKINFLLTPAKI